MEVPLCGLCPSLGLEVPEEEKTWEEHQEQLEKEMQEARRMVFHLQVSPETLRGGTSLRTLNAPFEYISRNHSSVLDADLSRISFSRQDKHAALVLFSEICGFVISGGLAGRPIAVLLHSRPKNKTESRK